MQRPAKIRQMPTTARGILLFALLVILTLNGCGRLTPKTAALKQVHDTYRSEFLRYIQLTIPVAAPSASSPGATGPNLAPSTAGKDEPVFAETLRQIREYRAKYGQTSQEAAHLTVLEGMIYLQTNELGLARLIKGDVKEAGKKLTSGTGDAVRDQLLAENFDALVSGWQEIRNRKEPQGIVLQNLIDAAKAIDSQLRDRIKNADQGAKIAMKNDDGALYLATTAAIFNMYVFSQCESPDPSIPPRPPCTPPNTLQQYAKPGADLIGEFLTDTEKQAADNDAKMAQDTLGGRFRFISWYSYLKQAAKQ